MRTSLTVGEFGLLASAGSSRCRIPRFHCVREALHFPIIEKLWARLLLDLAVPNLGIPSLTRSSRLPLAQLTNLLSKQAMWSLVFEPLLGFWRSSMGKTVAAISATISREEVEPKESG